MLCPKCSVEMRIKSSDYVTNNGALFFRQTFTCRKKDCPNYGEDVKSIYMPLNVLNDSDAEGDTPPMNGDGTLEESEATDEKAAETKDPEKEISETTEEVTEDV